ncbi:MAG: succinate dehydrogenase [Thermoanaerobacteraceae bacterium]|nr:succinate dehydrogenase [Thermoanaerobacteraceae bacterium]
MMLGDNSYVLRKLHSLTGIIPLGLFIMEHFFINSFLLQGEEEFEGAVNFLHRIPYLWVLELLIAAAFVFHAGYGLYIVFTGKSNVGRYGYVRNWLFLFQRITAVVILVFLIVHVYTLRFSDLEITYAALSQALSSGFMVAILTLGVLATVFHLANGISTFLISWGITIGLRAQRFFGYASLFVFFVLLLVGINIIRLFG